MGLPTALAVAIAVLVGAFVAVDGRPSAVPRPESAPTAGPSLTPSELAGRWTGEGALSGCAGFDDGGCPRTLPLTLSVGCAGPSCAVVPVGRGDGNPHLRFEAGRYRAAGPVRAALAPTCLGTASGSARWVLDLVVLDGRLVGSYAESTGQNINCGATSLTWDVTLERA